MCSDCEIKMNKLLVRDAYVVQDEFPFHFFLYGKEIKRIVGKAKFHPLGGIDYQDFYKIELSYENLEIEATGGDILGYEFKNSIPEMLRLDIRKAYHLMKYKEFKFFRFEK